MSYSDLENFGRPVTTSSDQAQLWVDREINWIYGFNHEAAVTCFEHAIAADPSCAMAYPRIVYALGPN